MAEELGHIDIRFPSAPGGAAGDTTGPLPTKISMPDMGSSIANTMRAAMGDFTAIAKMIVGNVLAAVDSIKNFVNTTVSEIRERGKFSPDVLMENVAQQMQDLSNQFQEAKVLGPLYAMILRWYRELMQLLQPWRLLFQTLISLIAGAVLATLNKLMTVVNMGLEALLNGISRVLSSVAALAGILAAPGALQAVSGAAIGGALGGNVGLGLAIANAVADNIPDTGLSDLVRQIGKLAELTNKSIEQLRAINNNTSPQASGGLDWVGTQLREIASSSPNWSRRKGVNPFYQTKGAGRLGGYP